MVNKALRTEDIDQLYIFRFFIGDLSENLVRGHRKIVSSGERLLTLYRGVKLSHNEFDKLKENEGQLISTNGYLSTSRCRSLTLTFATKRTKRKDIISVPFEIECDMQQLGESVIFADIAEFSDYPQEQAVLFDLGAAFRVQSVQQEAEMWLIKMKATAQGREIIQDYLQETRREIEEKSVAIMFGRLMCNMGQYEKSQKYFEQLLIDPNGEDPAWIEYNIGRALDFEGDWNAARRFYDCTLNRMMQGDPPRIGDSAYVIDNLGTVLYEQGLYDEALDYYRRALALREYYYPNAHVDIARSLNNVGLILNVQGKYDEALDLHRLALAIKQKCYPTGHVSIADSLINISRVLYQQSKYDDAEDYYHEALVMQQKCNTVSHDDLCESFINISRLQRERNFSSLAVARQSAACNLC